MIDVIRPGDHGEDLVLAADLRCSFIPRRLLRATEHSKAVREALKDTDKMLAKLVEAPDASGSR